MNFSSLELHKHILLNTVYRRYIYICISKELPHFSEEEAEAEKGYLTKIKPKWSP
jgi:hypothetical protein